MQRWLTSALVFPLLSNFCRRASDYRQNTITLQKCYRWLQQFPLADQYTIASLLSKIRYFSERETKKLLIAHNHKLIQKLEKEGVSPEKIIYVTLDDPGSSSHIMFNLLRDGANLEKRGFQVCDNGNIVRFAELTTSLGNGAIIYVDDFSASGKQFLRSRNSIAAQTPLIDSFSEFFLLPSICSEAHAAVSEVGIRVVCEHIHHTSERPLHPSNVNSDLRSLKNIVAQCNLIDGESPIGFEGMGTMVAFFSNTPNTTPKIFRGCPGQTPYFGILPRSTDLFLPLQVPEVA